jgi:hypothetical protein
MAEGLFSSGRFVPWLAVRLRTGVDQWLMIRLHRFERAGWNECTEDRGGWDGPCQRAMANPHSVPDRGQASASRSPWQARHDRSISAG